MTKLSARVPTSSMLLAILSLGLMRVSSLRPIRIAISVPVRPAPPSRWMANQRRG